MGQLVVESNPNTGVKSVVAMIEVTTAGHPMFSQRIRWRGHLNSPTNRETTVLELRAMGWRGTKLGDWTGFGSKEVEFSAMGDDSEFNGKPITYWRAAFVRPPLAVSTEKAITEDEIDELNAEMGDLLTVPTNGAARGPVPTPGDGYDRDPREPPPRLSGL